MSVEQSLLGKETQYPTNYQPDVLFPMLVLSLVKPTRILKVLHKVKIGGMF